MIASKKIRQSLNAVIPALPYYRRMDEGNHLRAWRKYRRMTQQELADAIGTAKSVISDLERGVVQLSPKWLRRLAPVLGTQPGHLLDYDPDELDSDIIDIWSRIDVDDRATALRMLEGLRRTGTND